jgi:hypothetical protein
MGQARLIGRDAQLVILSQDTLVPIPLGELDNFHAESQTSIIKSRPVGYVNEKATLKYGGWDLSFGGGKVDWALCHFYWLQDKRLRSGNLPPNFAVWEIVKHYNGAIEHYLYKNVAIFGLSLTREGGINELKEDIKAFSPVRTLGTADTTIIKDPIGNALREAVFRTKIKTNLLNDERIL